MDYVTGTKQAPAPTRYDLMVGSAVGHGLLDEDRPLVSLLDLSAVRASARALHEAFAEVAAQPQRIQHTFAVKAAALVPVLRQLNGLGIGCEVASPGELALARAAGVPAERIVLDSPSKTVAELETALTQGIAVNVDNPQELARLDSLRTAGAPTAPIGIRINPQLGAGSIDAMSTATATSKFGVALRDEGARAWFLEAFAARPWLNRLHCHTGSQGISLARLVDGVRVTYELAEEINAAAGRQQISTLDIGGGLPVNFDSDAVTPSHRDYARLLAAEVPGLFDGRYGIVTEFGRSLLAKAGLLLARVEYTKYAGGRRIAVTHAGVQVATRTVFAPESWPLRVAAYGPDGRRKTGPVIHQDVAGPACSAGDLIVRDRALPALEPGDLAALLDTGAYYASTPFGYNSLLRPAIYGFDLDAAGAPHFTVIRRAQTMEELIAESGGN